MNVPKEGPMGVEMLVHEKGAFLTVEEEAPFWMFWKTTRSCTASLDRWGLIWLYQTCSKVLRRSMGVPEDTLGEMVYDLVASFKGAPASMGPDEWRDKTLTHVAQQMRVKGWIKT